MRRRKLLLVAVGAIVVAAVGAVTLASFGPRPRFSRELVGRVQAGMTVDEVSAILGCHPGNYSDNIYGFPFFDWGNDYPDDALLKFPDRFKGWQADWFPVPPDVDGRQRRSALVVVVRLDEQGKTSRIHSAYFMYRVPSTAERFDSWLRGVRAKLGL